MKTSSKKKASLGKRENADRPRTIAAYRGAAAFVLLWLGTFLLFSRTLQCEFVNYDDPAYVSGNEVVQRGLTLDGIRWAFTTTTFSNWLPVTWLSHMMDVSIYGLKPAGHHATSALLHGLNAGLLFLALRKLTGSYARALAVAVLFAVHPLRVESVAWIAERKDVLAGTFFIAALLAYAGYAQRPTALRYAVVLVLHALGLMSKTMLVTLPAVLLLLDWWPLGRFDGADRRLRIRLLLEKLPLFALSVVASVWTVVLQEPAMASGYDLTRGQRVANAAVSVARYLGKTFWPVDLSPMYPHPGSWPTWAVIASTALIVVLTGAAALLAVRRRDARYALVGWLWFLVMLLPVSGIIQAGLQSMADRYTYLPGIGLAIAIVWLVADRLARRPKVGALAVAVVSVPLAVATWKQEGIWIDTYSLMSHAASVTRDNFVAHEQLGRQLAARNDPAGADAHFAEAARINPGYVEAWYNWGNLLIRQGHPAEAAERYRNAVALAPHNADARLGLGTASAMTGDFAGAEHEYRAALSAKPNWPVALLNLAGALKNQGRSAEAVSTYQQVLAIDPSNARAQHGLAEIRAASGQPPG